MRVISGRLRGRRLEAPSGSGTRPITDRVKETLFNIVGSRLGQPGALPGVPVLDLFAGSGGLGIEAVSRGAESCLFVERDRRALRTLRENLDRVGLLGTCRIAADNAWTLRIPPAGDGYGLVFLDPPYREAEDVLRVVDLLDRVATSMVIGGLAVFRHEKRTRLPVDSLRLLDCVTEREMGTMRVWIFERVAPPEVLAPL
ncbi:MAG: 16S rRNA (guanine(966)-N(2))-methyltransferase RsmD [Phycisphaerae bacterium]|jgi:16S rRNA (guanine966-N2)-methyltransferase